MIQLHIELLDLQPKVWRRILVPASITLIKLHQVIQIVMGWEDSHLHQFLINQKRYQILYPDWDMDEKILSEKRVRLETALQGSPSMLYIYDFGDHWRHEIKVEPLAEKYQDTKAPACVDGQNACPPDDCGGTSGYEHFLEIMADPTDSEYQENLRWLGVDSWDATAFDIIAINKKLDRLR